MSSLDAEDLENVPLVRMQDVQPIDRGDLSQDDEEEVLETCIIDDADYEECVVDDEDSNIGSMVSIQSEEVSESVGLIVPDVLEPEEEVAVEIASEPQNQTEAKPNKTDSWPTLEILPGGVINLADKNDQQNLYSGTIERDTISDSGVRYSVPGDMMYACAKCSESFKFLFSLVKHVKWHEDEEKKKKGLEFAKIKAKKITNRKTSEGRDKKAINKPCRSACKRKTIPKDKIRKVPKKS